MINVMTKKSAPPPPPPRKRLRLRWPRLSTINNILLGLIIVVDLYVILAPMFPAAAFWWQSHHTHTRQALTARLHPAKQPATKPATVQPNHVIIPSMLLDQSILEGPVSQQYRILDQGIWRWPAGSTPDKGGNTVLIGHRFTYTNPRGVFYFLNKVVIGDEIGLFWANQEYLYKVSSITVVPPTQTSIEDATTDARLTIFTCTPLWLPKNRLVVVAELERS